MQLEHDSNLVVRLMEVDGGDESIGHHLRFLVVGLLLTFLNCGQSGLVW